MIEIKQKEGSIKKEKGISYITLPEYRVYRDGINIGTVRRFCCGVDFRPNYSKGIFSILNVKGYFDKDLKKCIEAIASIYIPDCYFHYNFSIKTLNRLDEYEEKLNKQFKTWKEEFRKCDV